MWTLDKPMASLGTIQVLHNAVGVGVYGSVQTSFSKVYNPMLLAFRGGGGVQCPEKKRYVTLEWPFVCCHLGYSLYGNLVNIA